MNHKEGEREGVKLTPHYAAGVRAALAELAKRAKGKKGDAQPLTPAEWIWSLLPGITIRSVGSRPQQAKGGTRTEGS